MHTRTKFPIEKEDAFIRDYLSGTDGTFVLAKKYGVSAVTLVNALHRRNIEIRGKRMPRVSPDILDANIAMQKEAMEGIETAMRKSDYIELGSALKKYRTRGEMAACLGVSLVTFSRALAVRGIGYPSIHAVRLAKLSILALEAERNEADLL